VELLQSITPQSWLQDFRFLLGGVLGGGQEDAQRARLEDYLETRYLPDLVPDLFVALMNSYNWTAKNWDYLQEVGMVGMTTEGRITMTNSVVYALHDVAMSAPPAILHMLPDVDPLKVVRIAQRHIDAEKNQQPDTSK
jgi:hypothetical protein